MKELVRQYEEAVKLGYSKISYANLNELPCLLCNPIGLEINQHGLYLTTASFKKACRELGCPWIVILNKTCDEATTNNDSLESIYSTHDKKRQRARITQLKKWIKIYEKEV